MKYLKVTIEDKNGRVMSEKSTDELQLYFDADGKNYQATEIDFVNIITDEIQDRFYDLNKEENSK